MGLLVRVNSDTLTQCYSNAAVAGDLNLGGPVGSDHRTVTATGCYTKFIGSQQWRWGYVIGTSGPDRRVLRGIDDNIALEVS